jgi:sugar phosphate isomerase/epimerase
MNIKGFGVNIMQNHSVNDISVFAEKLNKIVNIGFNTVEIPVQGMDIIVNGRIDYKRLSLYKELLKDYPIRILIHAPLELNLFCSENFETEKRLLFSSLEVSAELGAEVMTYHPARFISEDEFFYPGNRKTYKDDEKKELVENERIIMQEAGALAAEHNIVIGMENLRPYLDCPHYSYSEIPAVLAEQVKAIDRPSIGITLDLGHLLLASKVYDLDIEEQMTAIAPLVVHIHAHDNFGKPSYSSEKDQYALVPRGMGDMHMPVGEGAVPLKDILTILYPYYDGYIINELRDRYESKWETVYTKWDEILKSMMPVTIKSESCGLYGK